MFSIEPLVAKRILPWFGGSAAVWGTCLVFYQTALLLGYIFARALTTRAALRRRAAIYIGVLAGSLAFLPIGPGERWRPGSARDPAWLILEMLTATIGLPFAMLSATSPLLQDWTGRAGHKSPYWLFAISNFASLAALLAYPTLIEPGLDLTAQRMWWSGLYVLFAALCILSLWRRSRAGAAQNVAAVDFEWTTPWKVCAWFVLAACGSMLLLSVTNHLLQNVAAIPLLWVLPLAVYLLTFVLSFGAQSIYGRAIWLRLLALALGFLGYAIYSINAVEAIQVSLPIFLGGLFLCCMFCHGELNNLRPGTSNLTFFYVMIAAGGAAGAIFIGLIAPHIFRGVYELPVTLVTTAAMAVAMIWSEGNWPVRLLWIGVTGCMAAVLIVHVEAYGENTLTLRRSFYGSLRVVQSPRAGPEQTRTLFHGTIEHGAQFLWPPRRLHPTTYYGPDSGIGIVLRECFNSPKRIGLVGLGIGTLAAYGQPGDTFRFYEINRQVVEIAESSFFYLRETHAAVEIVEGDARLSLERERGSRFDVLAIDAFSGDAIPLHLLTRQALALYLRHLKPDGVVAFHVSNDYLDLAPIVRQLAEEAGYHAVLARNHADDSEQILAADWVIVTNNATVLENAGIKVHSVPIASRTGLRPWTDDYNNLFQVLKTPQLRP